MMKVLLYLLGALGLTGLAYWLYTTYGNTAANTATNTATSTTTGSTAIKAVESGGQIKPRPLPASLHLTAAAPANNNSPGMVAGQVSVSGSIQTQAIHIAQSIQTPLATPAQANSFITGLKKTAWPYSVKAALKTAKTFSDGYYYTIPSGYDYTGFIVKFLMPSAFGNPSFYAVYIYDKSWNLRLTGNYQLMEGSDIVSLPATQWTTIR